MEYDGFDYMYGGKASQITEGFWIGGFAALHDVKFLEKRIDSIVNVSGELPTKIAWDKRYRHYPLSFDFNEERNNWKVALKAVEAVHEERKAGKRVLLNCHVGIDRSPTIGAKVLSEDMKIPLNMAATIIRKARPISNPHLSWWNTPRWIDQ